MAKDSAPLSSHAAGADQDWPALYRRAFAEFGGRALWNVANSTSPRQGMPWWPQSTPIMLCSPSGDLAHGSYQPSIRCNRNPVRCASQPAQNARLFRTFISLPLSVVKPALIAMAMMPAITAYSTDAIPRGSNAASRWGTWPEDAP